LRQVGLQLESYVEGGNPRTSLKSISVAGLCRANS